MLMAKPNPKPAKTAASSKKERSYLSQSDVPWYSVDEALKIAQAIIDNYGNGPARPLDVAQVLQVTPQNTDFKMLTGASIAYGLTEGGWNAQQIALTPLAFQILKPQTETAPLDGKREALLTPRIIREFLSKYDGNAVPREDIAYNVLETMKVPKDRTKKVLEMIVSSADSVGFLSDIKGKKYVNLKGVTPTEQRGNEEQQDEVIVMANGAAAKQASDKSQPPIVQPPIIAKPGTEARLARVFISHGKSRVFVDPIKQLLEMVQLQAVVSVESSTVSQPVTQKVMNDMRSSGAAIIHVDSEQKLIDPADTKEVVVLNPNVMIEIGAAMALYGERYILLVRDGVKLPSNLQGLYEVRYKGDKLDSDETIALLKSIHDMKTKALPSSLKPARLVRRESALLKNFLHRLRRGVCWQYPVFRQCRRVLRLDRLTVEMVGQPHDANLFQFVDQVLGVYTSVVNLHHADDGVLGRIVTLGAPSVR